MALKALYLSLISILILTDCSESSERNKIVEISHSIDSLRIKLDLPLIPENFFLESSGADCAIWMNEEGPFPKFWTKSIFWDSSGVYLERNYFYKSEYERIQTYCIFKEVKGFDTIGVCHFYEANMSDTGLLIPKKQRDSLLHEWGLK